jgi:enamine deaminase RidA (YjgF/YER057c/UK114 family)
MATEFERTNFSSGSPWEPVVGYTRAVRIGPHVWVSGTTAIDQNGAVIGRNNPGMQTRIILEIIGRALTETGATLKDVVRTRLYVRHISQWEDIGRVHGEVFADIRPASTMVEVSGLVDPDMLVEIEAEAYIRK